MIKFFPVLIFLASCLNTKEDNVINIFIDPGNYGWYFLELKEDSSAENSKVINVRFDSATYLQSVTVIRYDMFNFNVFDNAGVDLSSRMKLSSIVSHNSGKTFFSFYNPTDKELKDIQNWLPTDPGYNDIQNESRKKLERLIREN